jgi:hypothetical protein
MQSNKKSTPSLWCRKNIHRNASPLVNMGVIGKIWFTLRNFTIGIQFKNTPFCNMEACSNFYNIMLINMKI